MADDSTVQIGLAELRTEVRMLNEIVRRVVNRLEAHLNTEEAAKVATKRYSLTSIFAAGGIALTAIGLVAGIFGT